MIVRGSKPLILVDVSFPDEFGLWYLVWHSYVGN